MNKTRLVCPSRIIEWKEVIKYSILYFQSLRVKTSLKGRVLEVPKMFDFPFKLNQSSTHVMKKKKA